MQGFAEDFSAIQRQLKIRFTPNPKTGSAAVFLWGPRQTGKSTLLEQRYPNAKYYDLLDTSLRTELVLRPKLMREELLAESPALAIVDEVQKVPALLDEIHWLLEHTSTQFILCGSSARKLRREAQQLLGGRAVERFLFPLTSVELPQLDLEKALNDGLLPVHYLVEEPQPLLRAYVNAYIREEVLDESLTRNIPAFSRFLQVVALTHGQQLNYSNVARESGVSPSTVRNYFRILKDTLLGFDLEPWRSSTKRRMVETAKFYLFDMGVANQLHPEAIKLSPGTDLYGRAFEHFLLNEVRAFFSYSQLDWPLCYWRTSSGLEVDLIIGNMQAAIEFKATTRIRPSDLKGLRSLCDEHTPTRKLLVYRGEETRRTEDGIEILPWQKFCKILWKDELV